MTKPYSMYEIKQAVSAEEKYGDKHVANWCLEQVKLLRQQKADNEQYVQSEITQLKTWLETENAKLDQMIQTYHDHLYNYARIQRKKFPTQKTFHLPKGKVVFRKKPLHWEYDEKRLIWYFLKTNQIHFLRIELKKDELKKYFEVKGNYVYDPHTGEQLQGIKVREQGETFVIMPD